MKIVNWNIEWMNKWFSGNANPIWGSGSLSAARANQAAARAANVIRALDPDLLCLQEGPSSREEMDLFLTDHLSDNNGDPIYEALIGADGGAQKLYALRKLAGRVAAFDLATDAKTLALADVWDADVDGDMMLQSYDFTRRPLIVDVDPIGEDPIRVVILHTKSKYVHNGEARFNDPAQRQSFVIDALKARRRISAEGFRLRTYLDALLQDDGDARVVVTGDFNDGPGADFFERSYLTHNVADIVLGSVFYPSLIFSHPIMERVATPALFTARFDDFIDQVQDRPLLLDHLLVSPSLASDIQDAGIAHQEYEAEINGNGTAREDRPSDHRPVWAEIS